jgi:putative ABC transport system permease protein
MVSHYTAAHTREFAIRKVFGADSGGIMISQQVHILKMFLPGLVIGGALAWFIMRRWLQEYAHRIEMEGWVFLLGPFIILLFALLSISIQTWKSSRLSPAVSLKHL